MSCNNDVEKTITEQELTSQEIIFEECNLKEDVLFLEALEYSKSYTDYYAIKVFCDYYIENANSNSASLASLFISKSNRDKINITSSNKEIYDYLENVYYEYSE